MSGNAFGGQIPSDSGYPEPGGRAPAPAPLRLAQVFVNTADREAGTDALGTSQDLLDWLAGYGLLEEGEQASPDDLALALDLREGLRALFLTHHDGEYSDHGDDGNHGEPYDDDRNTGAAPEGGVKHSQENPAPGVDPGLQRLNRALEQLPVRVALSGGRPHVEPAAQRPVRAALARIGAVLVSADPAQLTRLKACRRDVCRWIFFDTSRNRGGTWCAMEICGARTKMQTYRRRKA